MELPIELVGGTKGKVCKYCKEEKPYNEFTKQPGNKTDGYENRCKKCRYEREDFIKEVKRFCPENTGVCQVNGCIRPATDCDHDPLIKDPRLSFRGWLCSDHNTSIGKCEDTLDGVLELAEYLKRHRNRVGSI